jgi:hypothetical protein
VSYEANTKDWQLGDVVIHAADAKRWEMLMHVIKIERDGRLTTAYMFPDSYREDFPGRGFYVNDKKHLLDPSRFGITIPDNQPKDGYL